MIVREFLPIVVETIRSIPKMIYSIRNTFRIIRRQSNRIYIYIYIHVNLSSTRCNGQHQSVRASNTDVNDLNRGALTANFSLTSWEILEKLRLTEQLTSQTCPVRYLQKFRHSFHSNSINDLTKLPISLLYGAPYLFIYFSNILIFQTGENLKSNRRRKSNNNKKKRTF